jgi:Fe-S-cluster containining protein
LRLTLSVEEAIVWASRGDLVQILCHAAPDTGERTETADYKRERRFVARSGKLTIQVQVILVARFEGACPNLGPDMRCGIYDKRPNVCRIYPAEIIPGRVMNPANRVCPPEAWAESQPQFLTDDGRVLDNVTNNALANARAAGLSDLQARQSLVAALDIDVTALENDGFTVWTINPAELVILLRDAAKSSTRLVASNDVPDWRFMSPRAEIAALISSAGAALATEPQQSHFEFLPLY